MTGEKRPTDHLEPAAKKRGSERQITKDDADQDEEEVVAGVYARASEDVLKQRRMIRARRSAAPVTSATIPASNPFAAVKLAPTNIETVPAANPFAGVSLAPPKPAEELPVAEKPTSPGDAAPEKKAENQHDPTGKSEQVKPDSGGFGALASGGSLAFGASSGGFGALSSGSGGGFGGFSAAASNGGGVFAFGSSAAAVKEGEDKTEIAPAAAATGGGEGSNIFGSATASGTALFGIAPKPAAAEFPTECTVSTGEEAERTVFTGDGFFLFEFDSGKQWRERGRGQVRVNVDEAKGQARVVMRQKGNLRLLLNANLWPEMQVTRMDGGSGVTFACLNHLEGAEGVATAESDTQGKGPPSGKFATYALRIKSGEVLDQFCSVLEEHKHGF